MNKKEIIYFLSIIVFAIIMIEYLSFSKQLVFNEVELNNDNKSIERKNIKFVNYNTTWCYWSKKLQPTWEKLVDMAKYDDSIDIVDVKCDLKENENECKEQQIQGFPTLRLFVDGQYVDYQGDRSLEDIKQFIESHQ